MPSSQRQSSRRSKTYKPPPFGFSDVRSFIDKFESYESNITECTATVTEDHNDFPINEGKYVKLDVTKILLCNIGRFVSKCTPNVTFGNLGAFAVAVALVAPKMIAYLLLYPFFRLVFGTLYPAYASYKAVRTKNLKEYVKWMMYWIVFALFTCAETFTDVFLSWFPFYYEVKIILVLWLLSPATKGSSILYRKFVHPALSRREQEIDDAIAKAKEQGYHTVLNLGSKGVNYATTVIMQTAIRGGGGLVQQLRKSYSLSDLTDTLAVTDGQQSTDEADDVLTEPRLIRRSVVRSGYNTRRSASESNNRSPLYFAEVDVDVRSTRSSNPQDFSQIKSTEDISSGYSSADNSKEHSLTRTGSIGASSRPRTRQMTARSTVTTIKRPVAAEGSEVIIEELHDNENVDYETIPPLIDLPPSLHISDTNPPFLFENVGNEIRIIQILDNINQCNEWQTEDNTLKCKPRDENENENASKLNDLQSENVSPLVIQNKDVHVSVDPIVFNASNVSCENVKSETENKNYESNENFKTPSVLVDDEISNTKNENISSNKLEEVQSLLNCESTLSVSSSSASLNSAKTSPSTDKDECIENVSTDAPSINDDAAETDDEASYGTPEDSPKAKKKAKRGKYGKNKAPAPPIEIIQKSGDENVNVTIDTNISENVKNDDKEKLTTKMDSDLQPETMAEFGVASISAKSTIQELHGCISKRNRRHKSKSPVGRKTGSSPISRLMQIPGKLAFWNKTDEKDKTDTWSTSSSEYSHNSSRNFEDTESYSDLNKVIKLADTATIGPNVNIPTTTCNHNVDEDDNTTSKIIRLNEHNDLEEAAIAKDILDKSDALKKLIEAKLESHPEYKIVSLHGDEPATTSKSTDV